MTRRWCLGRLWWSSGEDSTPLQRGARVPSLVGELDSTLHVPGPKYRRLCLEWSYVNGRQLQWRKTADTISALMGVMLTRLDYTIKPLSAFSPSSRPSDVWVSEAGVVQPAGFWSPAAWGLKSAWPLMTSVTCRKPATLPRPQRVQLAVPNSYPGHAWIAMVMRSGGVH